MAAPPESSTRIAKIVRWDNQKGYGFLQVGKRTVFLHWRDFAERHKRPAVGDVIRFTLGRDSKGRECAQNAVHLNDGGRITAQTVMVLAGLLVLPVLALRKCGVDLLWIGAGVVIMGAISYACYARDKRLAREKRWRISEAQLHVTELLGGWPGAFVAQRRLRHKCSKTDYQFVFWLIVLAYQFASIDSLQDWKFTRAAWSYLGHPSRPAEYLDGATLKMQHAGSRRGLHPISATLFPALLQSSVGFDSTGDRAFKGELPS